MGILTPEEQELSQKLQALEQLKGQLAEDELQLTTLKAQLHEFECEYLVRVATKYVELDRLRADLAERRAQQDPRNIHLQGEASDARAQAQASESATREASDHGSAPAKFVASDSLKKLYRDVAKQIHPDLATDDAERARCHHYMVLLNDAYAIGNEAAVQAILRDWSSSPETVAGEGVAADLVRAIRQVAQLRARVIQVAEERRAMENSELFALLSKCNDAASVGMDLIAQVGAALDEQILVAREELLHLGHR